ncbi:uncharacterized protein MELLADRAFT_88248 [Melampsora larici-populina 98AG31]|uniref:Roadblock/LAMTOR2 domain-containing protein n=1 Tax=Melampsora larici-populina (strain 98AG31 / pathotype 3-4-7) TaxID=747676 RepID=F4RR38_MELLP|nr:uncharacterized protein MELLADRAFT_88248 [Melampsora larici-populina 98AG31]EGG05215.1 hypothetical protein MELLADRAFT_88248 [Melampsora larici-populina 98AG31]
MNARNIKGWTCLDRVAIFHTDLKTNLANPRAPSKLRSPSVKFDISPPPPEINMTSTHQAPPTSNQSHTLLPPGSSTSNTSSSAPNQTINQSSASVPAPPEVEATIQRLSQHKNVRAVIILNKEGVVIRSAGPILQGSDGLVVLRRYASEARKMVEAMGKSIEGMEVDSIC